MVGTRLQLDDQLCFAIYVANNALTRAYRPLLRELGITYPQYLTLVALWQHGPATVHEIAEYLDLPANALTPLLQRLETAGLVVRRRSPRDGRALLVQLTSAGVQLEASAAAVQRAVGHATGLSPQTLGALRDELHDLADVLRAG